MIDYFNKHDISLWEYREKVIILKPTNKTLSSSILGVLWQGIVKNKYISPLL